MVRSVRFVPLGAVCRNSEPSHEIAGHQDDVGRHGQPKILVGKLKWDWKQTQLTDQRQNDQYKGNQEYEYCRWVEAHDQTPSIASATL